MNFRRFKSIIGAVLVISLVSSCSPSQKIIDNIIPDYNERLYCIADLIPYNYKELRNAQALYGNELSEYFYKSISTESKTKRSGKLEDDAAFNKDLRYRNANYKLFRERIAMYFDEDNNKSESMEKEREEEYNAYYKLQNAVGSDTIKKYNGGKLNGMPLMSIRVDMSTATMSSIDSICSGAMCEIYKPVVIDSKTYDKLKFGDEIDLVVPATNSTINCKETKTVKCTYIATDSLMYLDAEGEKQYYFIADSDGINKNYRRVLDYYGRTLETFVEYKELQFMKYARVARANEQNRLLDDIAFDRLVSYDFDKLAVRALGGGYLVYDYKDYIYANSISTNLKGYITSLYYYDNQRIGNEFYDSLD